MTHKNDLHDAPIETPYCVALLPDHLIDQIAAGEVVERPASVVKELVENAIDAGAKRIRVEVRDGGLAWIAVTDDGRGMTPDDVRRAMQRHATSKIRSAEDLSAIHTFGFRGEALPAIASVSRFRVRSLVRGAREGLELQFDGGKLVAERAAGGPTGTRIEVADLFASVPARRKFLKRASTEWGHIADWLARVALVLPQIHFEVYREDRQAIVWPATERAIDRVASVLSEADAAAQVAVEGEIGDYRVHGFCSRPDHHLRTAASIYLFVNGRPVRDRLLLHALQQEYRDLLPRGRFPSAVLFLEVPPHAVDVNVHPAKWEVRFADPQLLHRLVSHSVRAALSGRTWLGRGLEPVEEGPASPHRTDVGARIFARATGSHTDATPSDWSLAATSDAAGAGCVREGSDVVQSDGASQLGVTSQALQHRLFASQAEQENVSLTGADNARETRVVFGAMRRLGQFRATYLLLEAEDALLLVDQHAAHERVLYEGLRARWFEGAIERQPLLLPRSVELDAPAFASLLDASSTVEKLGFEIEPFGASSVVVRAIPALLEGRDPAMLVQSLAEELHAAEALGVSLKLDSRVLDAVDALFASLACHGARRKGEVLNEREQIELLRALDRIPWAPTCPHGRPVAVPLTLHEIERRFLRR